MEVIASPFHSKIPNAVEAVSTQYAPFAGSPAGAVALAFNAPRSTSARTTQALFETPSNEYAACKPYSFSSPPCIALLLASV